MMDDFAFEDFVCAYVCVYVQFLSLFLKLRKANNIPIIS